MTPKQYDDQLGHALIDILCPDIGECVDPSVRNLESAKAEIVTLKGHIEWLTKEYHDVCLRLENLRISVRNAHPRNT